MDSILFLVIALAINLVIKSANDKKKIEEARRKRAEKLKKSPIQNKIKDVMSTLNQELEKRQRTIFEYSQEQDKQRKEIEEVRPNTSTENISYVKRKEAARKETEDLAIDPLENNKDKIRKKELLNGIIWSEILSEPKGIQNIKRGM